MKLNNLIKNKFRFFYHLLNPQQLKYGVLFITHKCNMRCPYCQITQMENNEIGLSEWKVIIEQLSKSGVSHFNILGGEPLLLSDLVIDLTKYISDKGRGVTLTTNGHLLSSSLIKQLAQAGLFMLILSVDELRGDEGKSDFFRIAPLLDLATKHGIVPVIHCVITSLNVEQVPLLAKEVTNRGFIFSCSVYQSVGGFQSKCSVDLTPNVQLTEAAFKQIKVIKKQSGLVRTTLKYMDDYPKYAGGQKWLCNSSQTKWIAVNCDGRLMVCAEWCTNISAMEVLKIPNPEWNLTKREIVAGCSGCYYECYYSEEEVFTINGLLKEFPKARPFWAIVKKLICANIRLSEDNIETN